MFFRRKQAPNPSFTERLEALRDLGFSATPAADGVTRIARGACAVDWSNGGRPGVLMGSGIGQLVDGGFQKFFQTESGRRKPATADELKALHEFEEDLKEALGGESYYNQSLGSVSTYYHYDRLKDRDRGVPRRAWE
jgi:hypothetical protein